MGRGKLDYPQEFRRKAVQLARRGDRTQEDLARDLGVSSRQIRRWLRRTEAEETIQAARKAGAVPLRDLEVHRLKRQIKELEEANAALKESVHFLSARRRK